MKLVSVIVTLALFCCPVLAAQSQGQATTPPVSSAQTEAHPAPPASTPEKLSPEALAQKYVELWNTGNFDLIHSIFEFPAIMTSRGSRVPLDPGMLKRVISAWRKSMPDLNFKIQDTIVQGDKVAVRVAFTGSYRERLFANTADPKDLPRSISATAMWVFEMRDGKIRQIWEEYDEIKMHYEMGGFWRSNAELEAAAKAGAQMSPPIPEPAPSSVAPPKP